MRRSHLGVGLAVAIAGALAVSGVASAKTQVVSAKAVTLAAATAESTDDLFRLEWPSTSAYCPRNAAALAAGWSGAGAYVGEIDTAFTSPTGVWNYELRRNTFTGPTKTTLLCIRGAGRVTERSAAKGTVSCGRNIAVGLPVYYGSASHRAGGSFPVGISRWKTDTGDHFSAKALCVPRRAFGAVRTVNKAGALPAGRVSASVTVTCPARHRAIGWGYNVAAIPGYTPSQGIRRTVPYVSASHPSGQRAWRVQFTTPEGTPATGATPVRAYAVCGVPA
mgnify:CR=1 FL=1